MAEERAQITIEALLIMGVFILLLISVSLQNIFQAVDSTRDVQVVSDARFASEQIVNAANVISNPYEKKRLKIHIPGYSSPGTTSEGNPIIWITTCISTDGDVLATTIQIKRYGDDGNITQNDEYSFNRDLPGEGWEIYVPNATLSKPIYEDDGYSYTLDISWKNITSQTNLEWIVDNCTVEGFDAKTSGGR
jgi:hypothetical protein